MKVFSANLKCVSVRVRMRPILPLTHESFLREIFYFHIFAKVLSLESFPLYGMVQHVHYDTGSKAWYSMYIVVAVPKQDSMSPARANAAPVWALQLYLTTSGNRLQTTLCSTVA